jgi:hypothetical protein
MAKPKKPAPTPTVDETTEPPQVGEIADDVLSKLKGNLGPDDEEQDSTELEEAYVYNDEEENYDNGESEDAQELFLLACGSNNQMWIANRDELWEYSKEFKKLEGFDEDSFSIYRLGNQVVIKSHHVELEEM